MSRSLNGDGPDGSGGRGPEGEGASGRGGISEEPNPMNIHIPKLAHYNREGQPISEEAGVVGKNYSITERSNTANITVIHGLH